MVYDCKERTVVSTTAISEVGNDEVPKQLLKLNFRPLQIPACGEATYDAQYMLNACDTSNHRESANRSAAPMTISRGEDIFSRGRCEKSR